MGRPSAEAEAPGGEGAAGGETSTTRVEVRGFEVVAAGRNLEHEDDAVDPYFFDSDHSIAAATGFARAWEGSLALVRRLDADGAFGARFAGRRVVEVGSGTGLLGLCVAACGGHVLLTDLPPVVEGALRPNLDRNTAAAGGGAGPADGGWAGARACGRLGGSAAAMALDWGAPVAEQFAEHGRDAGACEVVLAAECTFLAELLAPLVATVAGLLHGPRRPKCLLAHKDRAKAGSAVLVTREAIEAQFAASGCEARLLFSEPCAEEPDRQIHLLEIAATRAPPAAGTGGRADG